MAWKKEGREVELPTSNEEERVIEEQQAAAAKAPWGSEPVAWQPPPSSSSCNVLEVPKWRFDCNWKLLRLRS